MQENRTQPFHTIRLVYMAAFVALNLVLMRVLRLELGAYRITIGHIATIMAGLWLGPVSGAVCGLTADVLGCLIDGYAVNPLISLAAVLWGVIPAAVSGALAGKNKAQKTAGIVASVCCTSVLSILCLTTAGLVLIMGYNLYAILPGRAVLCGIMAGIYSVLTCLLYFSPATRILQEKLAGNQNRQKS